MDLSWEGSRFGENKTVTNNSITKYRPPFTFLRLRAYVFGIPPPAKDNDVKMIGNKVLLTDTHHCPLT